MQTRTYRTAIFTAILYGYKAWSLTSKEKHRLRVFENRVLRKTWGPKRDEVAGKRKRLHNREPYDLHSLPNTIWVIKSRRMRRAGACGMYGTDERCIQGFGEDNCRKKTT
jgi:hypothetical protein